MNSIIIPERILSECDDLAVYIYSAFQPFEEFILREHKVVIQQLYHQLYGKISCTKPQRERISSSLEQLKSRGILDYNESFLTFFPNGLKPKEGEYYASITFPEFDAVAGLKCKLNRKTAIYKTFCDLVYSFNWNIDVNGKSHILGTMPQAYFAAKMNTTVQSIGIYIKELERLGLIYVTHRPYMGDSDTYPSNVYGRCEDRALIDQFVETNKRTGDFKRSVKARLNHYKKNPEAYTSEQVAALKSDLEVYNKMMTLEIA